MSITEHEIQQAYFEVLSNNDAIPYTQEGADFIYEEIKKTLGISDGVFEVVALSATSRGVCECRGLEFIVK